MKQFQVDGYVCGKIETRSTKSGKLVTSFNVNSPDRRKNQQGEWESFPSFFSCQYWHRFDNDWRAAAIVDKAHVVMTGDLRYESWEKDGKKGSKVLLNVADLWPVEDRREAAPKASASQPEYYQATYYDDPYADENLPF